MKRIVLAGVLGMHNHGEKFLRDSIEYLVKRIDATVDVSYLDFELRHNKVAFFVYRLVQHFIVATNINLKLKYRLMYVVYKVLYSLTYSNVIKHADALIFAAGSFKYRTQNLWLSYSVIVEMAQKYNVPVLFDAMNIQDYDENDLRCVCLKKHVNYPCVKMLTTRDGNFGVCKFDKFYKTNRELAVKAVGDPAFWLKECYELRDVEKNGVVGVNLIYGSQFKSYGGKTSEDALLKVYCDLVQQLDAHGRKWCLFTNGLPGDYKFGQKLCKELGCPETGILEFEDAKSFARFIAGCDSVIGARLHTCICAYAYNVPFAGFIWDEKLLRFAEISKTEVVFCDEENLSGGLLYQKLCIAEDTQYDNVNKDMWKEKTHESIEEFLSKL